MTTAQTESPEMQAFQEQAEAWLNEKFPGGAYDAYKRFSGTEMVIAFLAGISAGLKYSAKTITEDAQRIGKEVQDNDC